MTTISSIESWIVDVPLPRPFVGATHAITRSNVIVVRVRTDDGVEGIGLAHGSPLRSTAELIVNDLARFVVGMDPREIEYAWQSMFATTLQRRPGDMAGAAASLPKGAGKAQVMAAIGGIDIALWDIAGKLSGQPLWRMLGGMRQRVPAYATGGYYRDDDRPARLGDEFAGYVEQGYTRVKVKCGGREPHEDAARVAEVRAAIGPDVQLYVDATRGWDVPDAIRAGQLMEPHDVTWFEEPVPWYDDVEGLARVGREVRIPLCAGESEYTKEGVRDLLIRGGVRYVNFDCTKGGGITDGRKIAAIAEVHGAEISPHHAAEVHAHLVAAVGNGRDVEVHPDPDRDPLFDHLYAERPRIVDGYFELDEAPGLGIVLDEAYLDRHGVRLLPQT